MITGAGSQTPAQPLVSCSCSGCFCLKNPLPSLLRIKQLISDSSHIKHEAPVCKYIFLANKNVFANHLGTRYVTQDFASSCRFFSISLRHHFRKSKETYEQTQQKVQCVHHWVNFVLRIGCDGTTNHQLLAVHLSIQVMLICKESASLCCLGLTYRSIHSLELEVYVLVKGNCHMFVLRF